MQRSVYGASAAIFLSSALALPSDTGRLDGRPRVGDSSVVPVAAGIVVERPADFGPAGDSVSTFHFSAFQPVDSGFTTATDGQSVWPSSLSSGYGTIFHANLQVPEGAVIDHVYFRFCKTDASDTPVIFGASKDFGDFLDSGVPSTGPGCFWVLPTLTPGEGSGNTGHEFDLFVNWMSGATDGSVKLKQAEVWWHRAVSPAPLASDFLDVPTSDPRFAFIEAIYQAGITAGCGGGNYCPDSPLTRGQMAVFLAKALGVYWPNASAPQ